MWRKIRRRIGRLGRQIVFSVNFRHEQAVTIGSLPVGDDVIYMRSDGEYYRKVDISHHQRIGCADEPNAYQQPELFDPDELVNREEVIPAAAVERGK